MIWPVLNGFYVLIAFVAIHLKIQMILADFENSWMMYNEKPCCRNQAENTHYKEQIREFTCGKLYYRTFFMDSKQNFLYVGAMDHIYKLNALNISRSNCEVDALHLEATNTTSCINKGKTEDFDCRNHVRVIQSIGDGTLLYVCGTNGYNPKELAITANLTYLNRNTVIPGIASGLGSGVAKCPYNPDDNSTAIWVENGNPGGLSALYSGTNAEFGQGDSLIFRNDLFNYTTGRKEYSFQRTIKYDTIHLDKPNFVGSFEIGDYVFLFFREHSAEYINCGKSIYSRVARVCKTDTGGKHVLTQNWATYLKARLNCSIAGDFPFYFNEIQSVFKLPNDTTFYATFTTSANGFTGSAICKYSLSAVQAAFGGKFKTHSKFKWSVVDTLQVPSPRPGVCVNDTKTLPDAVLNFIRTKLIMDEAVSHEYQKPIFYQQGVVFTKLVVDMVNVDIGGATMDYIVYYIGTVTGRLLKVVEWQTNVNGPKTSSSLLDVLDVTPNEPIRVMEISSKHRMLFVGSDYRVKQINLTMCSYQYDNCLRCVQDPYCGWDKDSNVCRPYSPGLLQDVSKSSSNICELSIVRKSAVVTWGQSLHISCFEKLPTVFSGQSLTWYHYTKTKGRYEIHSRPDKYITTSERGLVIMGITEADKGHYDCWVGTSLLCSFNVTVDTHRCSPPAKNNDYHKIYSDWCHEFEKYKSAKKVWEKKKNQCAMSRLNNSNESIHPNEIFRPFV